jgi:hypothetical protein
MTRLPAVLLAAIGYCLSALSTPAAWLEWDRDDNPAILGTRLYFGTNAHLQSYDAGPTNMLWIPRLRLPPGATYTINATFYGAAFQTDFSNDIEWTVPERTPIAPITNVLLRVPSGKFYVEASDNLSTWTALATALGPTNFPCPITTNAMGYYRFRPYFLAAAAAKKGKLKFPR